MPRGAVLRRHPRARLLDDDDDVHPDKNAGAANAAQLSWLELLPGDLLAHVLGHVLALESAWEGAQRRGAVQRGVRALTALASASRPLADAVVHHAGAELWSEALGRRRAVAEPVRGRDDYLAQAKREAVSAQAVWMLRQAVQQIVLHCAGECCRTMRRSLNRTFSTTEGTAGAAIRPVALSARIMATARDAPVAFIHARRRRQPPSRERADELLRIDGHATRTKVYKPSCLAAHEHATHSLTLNLSTNSAPLYAAASPCGRWLAYIVAAHDPLQPENAPGPRSLALVWDTKTGHVRKLDPVTGYGWIEEASDTWVEAPPTLSPQSVGWREAQPGEPQTLVVAWSTTFLHPSGHTDSNSPRLASPTEHYLLVRHGVSESGEGDAGIEMEGPFWGRLCTFKLDARGRRGVALCAGPVRHSAVAHLLGTDQSLALRHDKADRRWRWGPTAAGISPAGDTIVTVDRTQGSVRVEVFDLTSNLLNYVAVASKDISHWVLLAGPADDPAAHIGLETADANFLKLPYDVGFSPCGRFAVVTDQRPLFGLTLPNHALVVLDLGTRYEHRSGGMRACPLASLENVAPRAIDWTAHGMWILTRHGACLMHSPAE
jgi:hypothetical protein